MSIKHKTPSFRAGFVNGNRLSLADPLHLMALGFGSGLSPFAPGTIGSLAALPLWSMLAQCGRLSYAVLVLIAALFGIFICGRAAKALGEEDPKMVVWDEFVGLWLSLITMPSCDWRWIVTGFVLFRLFDILKPWPIYLIERRFSGGVGIVLDDVVAGIFSATALWLLGVWLL